MTIRSLFYEGVARVRIAHFGSGTIVIEQGPRDDAVEGTLTCPTPEQLDAVAVALDGETLRVLGELRNAPRLDLHLRLGVPEGLDYVIDAASAEIALRAGARSVRLTTASGDVALAAVADLTVTNGSGDVAVASVTGRAARIETGSGGIRVLAAQAALEVTSGSGDVHIARVRAADVQVSTGSGDITVAATNGPVELRTLSGDITVGVVDELPTWLDLHADSGRIRIALDATAQPGAGEPYVAVRARTGSGEIAVYRA